MGSLSIPSGRVIADPLDPANVLPTLVERRAEESPERVFLVDIGHDEVTLAGFHARVLAWANALTDHGARPGCRVATMLPASVDAQAAWLACGWLGVLEVPVNMAYRHRMLAHVLNDSGAEIVVAHGSVMDRFEELGRLTTGVRRIIVVDDGAATRFGDQQLVVAANEALAASAGRAKLHCPMPWDIAAVMYTSGTTGPSKGVLVPWGQLASGIDVFDDCRPGDVLFAPFGPSHLAGKVPVQLMAYWRGTHVFRDGFKSSQFWADVRAHGCNRVWLFHAMANFVWRQPAQESDHDNPIETVTGGPMLHEYQEFEARFGVRMRTNFGMTESGWPIATGGDVPNHLTCGRARPGYDLRVVDEHDLDVPEGEMGELIVRSERPWVMNLGYFGLPEKTVEAWRNGWFHTGDAFRRDADGNWYFLDRMKDAIRRRGENISSFEVESLAGEHEAVLECAAIGVPSEYGEEEIKLCVVVKPGHSLSPEQLLVSLVTRMPSFMVPRYVEFMADLPKTPTGKVRKVELKADPFNDTTWDRLADAPAERRS